MPKHQNLFNPRLSHVVYEILKKTLEYSLRKRYTKICKFNIEMPIQEFHDSLNRKKNRYLMETLHTYFLPLSIH